MTDILVGMSLENAERLLTDRGIPFKVTDCLDRKTQTDGERRIARVVKKADGTVELTCMYFRKDVYGA